LNTTEELLTDLQLVLQGKSSELMQTALWNGGFYLWRCGVCSDMRSGIAKAEEILTSGAVAKKLQELTQAINLSTKTARNSVDSCLIESQCSKL
ncbi:MAG: hypothetical protein PUP92_25690, partial [Rhizonema sp. PD38]|nr:hypothetical protein [Rhizonema sp. PD38]